MTISACRNLRAVALVIIQLIIVPATHVLHLSCDHSSHVNATVTDSDHPAFSWCWSSHCRDCCPQQSVTTDSPAETPLSNQPVHPPHNKNSCPVCVVAFASRITTTILTVLVATEQVSEIITAVADSVSLTPRDCVLNRGPPLVLSG